MVGRVAQHREAPLLPWAPTLGPVPPSEPGPMRKRTVLRSRTCSSAIGLGIIREMLKRAVTVGPSTCGSSCTQRQTDCVTCKARLEDKG